MSTVNSLQKAEREIIIDFGLEHVKQSILKIYNTQGSKYSLYKDGANLVFNTFHSSISNGLNPAVMDITIEDAGANKTKIRVTVTNTYGAVSSNSVLSGLLSDYLNVLGQVLSNQNFQIPKSGCALLILAGIFTAILMSL